MIVEVFDCDLCGCKMKESWTEFYTHADKYWCSRASVHFCKDCSRKLRFPPKKAHSFRGGMNLALYN